MSRNAVTSRRLTGRGMRSTTRIRYDARAHCMRAERVSSPPKRPLSFALSAQPGTVLPDFDQGRTICAQGLADRLAQLLGTRGTRSATAEALRQTYEVR